MKVLYAEDEDSARDIVGSILKKQFKDVYLCRDGKEALEVFNKISPEIVISDISMPELDGIELSREIKKINPKTYIILATAFQDGDMLLDALNIGIDGYLLKPLDRDLIRSELKKAQLKIEYENNIDNQRDMLRDLIVEIFKVLRVGVCITDEDGVFVRVNRAYCDMYGYREDELLGRHFTMIVPKEQREFATKLHDDFIYNNKSEIPSKWLVQRRDGKLFHIIATAGRIVDKNDCVYKVTTADNITHLVELEEREKIQERMLIQQSKMAAMGEMIGAIAHQWRQPLNALSMTLGNIKQSFDFDELTKDELYTQIEKAKNQISFMSKTIDDFRNFFRTDREKESFEINRAIEECLKLIGAQLRDNSIEVTTALDSSLKLNGHFNEFNQAILNFLSNAKDAINERRDRESIELDGKISVEAKIVDNKITIEIADNGGGIKLEQIDSIFEPYFTTKDQGKGTGIGLYMSKMIVEQNMGGVLSAQNRDDGAVMIVEFLEN